MQSLITVRFGSRQIIPMMLSPMAGITNLPFRELCNDFARLGSGLDLSKTADSDNSSRVEAGLFVNEMLAARALAGRIYKVRSKLQFATNEQFRSMQLYCLDPEYSYLAAKQIVSENLTDHIDLNFGCPVKKVTKNGGGSALPTNPKLLREIVRSVKLGIDDGLKQRVADTGHDTANAVHVPLSAKFRIGFDDDEINFLRTADICVEEGCEMLTLHARTTAQFYSGVASWQYIRQLRDAVPKDILVFGNGDIWSANDATRMIEETGVDGVCIGRGAMGRPWLFYDIAQVFSGENSCYTPTLGEVAEIMMRHLNRTVQWITEQNELSHPNSTLDEDVKEINYERVAVRAFRANIGAYLKGFNLGGLKSEIMTANTASDIAELLQKLDFSQPYPVEVGAKPRGRTKSAKKVYLPRHWA